MYAHRRWMRGAVFFIILLVSMMACLNTSNNIPATDQPTEGNQPENSAPTELPNADRPLTGDEIEVLSMRARQNTFGDWYFFGLAHNTAAYPVTGAAVLLTALDADGEPLYQTTVVAAPFGLAPDGYFPLIAFTREDLSALEEVAAEVVKVQPLTAQPAAVEVRNTSWQVSESGDVLLVGEVYNPAEEGVAVSPVGGVLFDASEAILAAGLCDVCPQTLAPGETGPFRIYLLGCGLLDAQVTEMKVYAFAEAAPDAPVAGVTIQDSYLGYTDLLGSMHVLGELTNTQSEAVALTLLGSAYDESGVLINVAGYTLPFPALEPGETYPFDLAFDASFPVPEMHSWEIRVEVSGDAPAEGEYVRLSAVPDEYSGAGPVWNFSGMVENPTSQDIAQAEVILALRDNLTGKIVAVGDTTVFTPIPANSSAQFSITLPIEEGLAVDALGWELYAFGQ